MQNVVAVFNPVRVASGRFIRASRISVVPERSVPLKVQRACLITFLLSTPYLVRCHSSAHQGMINRTDDQRTEYASTTSTTPAFESPLLLATVEQTSRIQSRTAASRAQTQCPHRSHDFFHPIPNCSRWSSGRTAD